MLDCLVKIFKLKIFHGTFDESGLENIPEKLFENNDNAQNFYATFRSTPITSIPKNLFKENINATSFNSCFANTKIISIPNNLFYSPLYYNGEDKSDGVSFYSTFSGCTELQTIITRKMFCENDNSTEAQKCRSNIGNIEEMFRGSGITGVDGAMFEGAEKIKSIDFVFAFCGNLLSPKNPAEGEVQISADIFKGCINIGNMRATFISCGNIEYIPESAFDSFKDKKDENGKYRLYDLTKIYYHYVESPPWIYGIYREDWTLDDHYLYGIFTGCRKLNTAPKLWEWEKFKTNDYKTINQYYNLPEEKIYPNNYNAYCDVGEELQEVMRSSGDVARLWLEDRVPREGNPKGVFIRKDPWKGNN